MKKLQNLVPRTEQSDQFNIPPKGWLRDNCKIGDFVKVICEGERFWVEIVDLGESEDDMTGRVGNNLQRTDLHGLSEGTAVSVARRNVFDFMKADS